MKLVIKNLKQVPYEVDITDTKITVSDLKMIIEKTHGFEASKLKLLYNGVVLKDDKTLESYDIKENFVLIMMGSRLKVENKPAEQPQPQPNPQPSNVVPPSQPQPQPVVQPQPQPQPSQPSQPQAQPSPDYTSQINQLVEMGYPREEAENAIRAARGNLQLAVEYLCFGIPQNLPPDFGDMGQGLPSDIPQGGEGAQGQEDPLKVAASVIKCLCSGQPERLQMLLMNIQQTDPGLMELIRSREEEFRNLISTPVTDEDVRAFQNFSQQMPGMSGAGGMGGHEGGMHHGGGQHGRGIQVTKEEFEAIKRLKELGFSEAEAAQAYMAFDKNEELAANWLFEQKFNDDGVNLVIRDQPQQPAAGQQPAAAQTQPPSAPQPENQQSQSNPENPSQQNEEKKEEEKKNE